MIATLAKMLGLTTERAEASMHSERAARAVLTRRNLFAAGAALATGAVFSFGAAEPEGFYVQLSPQPPIITLPHLQPGEMLEVWIAGVKLPKIMPWPDVWRYAP